jgi:uncharacterized membrane protein YdjX (TVP38/TMEM64 family)
VKSARLGRGKPHVVYKTRMLATPPEAQARRFTRRLLPLIVLILLAIAGYFLLGHSGLSLESLVKHRAVIDDFVSAHPLLAVVGYIGLYIVAVVLSLPGAVFLTVTGGFLFGLAVGTAAAVVGATIGATVIFLVARTALCVPLLRRAGPRAAQLAQGFRDDAFSYLLFLRLVPVFPFFLVNLVPALAGVRLIPFVAATMLGVIPAALVYAFAGTGLDGVIAAQRAAYDACLAARQTDCHMSFDARNVLTPQLIAVLIALGLLTLIPVLVRRLRMRSRTTM